MDFIENQNAIAFHVTNSCQLQSHVSTLKFSITVDLSLQTGLSISQFPEIIQIKTVLFYIS